MSTLQAPPPSVDVSTLEPWVIVAQDGADDDGGTLYTLFDEGGAPLVCAAWPGPLEERALLAGRATVRGPSWTGSTTEIAEFKRRRSHVFEHEIDDQTIADGTHELETLEGALESALVAVAVPDRCKVEGCKNRYVQKLGPYGRLCEAHAAERKAARNGGPRAADELDAAREVFERLVEARLVVRQAQGEIERARAELAELLDELGRVFAA